MTSFEMVKYHSRDYPSDVPLRIEEIAAHFDVSHIGGSLERSLHTEYSYGKRRFNSLPVNEFHTIMQAQKEGVPQLWKSVQWAEEFALFITALVGNGQAPHVIEIHPPFSDYTDMDGFVHAYSVFESRILSAYPGVEILIENRCGSVYHGGKFLVSQLKDVAVLRDAIQKNNLRLKIAYDVPQMYTAHHAESEKLYISLLEQTKALRECIGGVHLWGKSRTTTGRKVSHCGDLNSYFENDIAVKDRFLEKFAECFDDSIARKMVLEVNSGNADMLSIFRDLRSVGIRFV